LSGNHDFANAHRPADHALPWSFGYAKRWTREEDRCRRRISSEQLCELFVGVATKG
jgi:hypothetical protein